MNQQQVEKARTFKDLHLADGIFVMPNAWDAGSACLLETAGFSAIATTSAGIAYSRGLPDYEAVLSRDEALLTTRQIAMAVDLPVNADAENGYGHSPEAVAETITEFVTAGVVGANIEDYSADYHSGLYEIDLAVERISAARAAADALGFSFTLTARTEGYLLNQPQAFVESVKRANAYRQAGADCLFVPGVKDADTIAALVKEIDGPLNVVMGLVGKPITLSQLEDIGVKRISIGGSLARATLGLIQRAAREIIEQGSFEYASQQIADSELCAFFSDRMQRKKSAEDIP